MIKNKAHLPNLSPKKIQKQRQQGLPSHQKSEIDGSLPDVVYKVHSSELR